MSLLIVYTRLLKTRLAAFYKRQPNKPNINNCT